MKPTILLEHDTPRPGEPLNVRALLLLEGEAPDDRSRVPLNLSLVLDRSGSMHGAKLEAARHAASLAVQRLWPEDVVSVVAYDDEVRVVAEPARGDAQQDLSAQLRSIEPGGTTNLSGGWLKGRELVARHRDPNGVNRVLLLTDGLANQGVTDPQQLMGLCRRAAEDGISTTTIGFGADYDERLLRSMADAGGGQTWYIEHAEQAAGVFEEELEGLLSLTAQNVAVEVRVGDPVLLAAVRHAYPSRETEDGALRLELGDLYAREPKRLLLELVVEEVPEAEPGEAVIATLSLAADVLEAGGGIVRRELELPIVLDVEGGARLDPEVRRETLLLDAARAREEALERQARGDWSGAAQVLGSAGVALREAGFADADLSEEALDLERMAETIAAAPASPADEKYLFQRAHEASRGRRSAKGKIARKWEDQDA